MTLPLQHDMRALAARLLDAADTIARRSGGDAHPFATEQFAAFVPPGTTMFTGQAQRDGRWWAYVTLPKSIEEKPKAGHWIFNPSESHWWLDAPGATEREAIGNALIKLLEAFR